MFVTQVFRIYLNHQYSVLKNSCVCLTVFFWRSPEMMSNSNQRSWVKPTRQAVEKEATFWENDWLVSRAPNTLWFFCPGGVSVCSGLVFTMEQSITTLITLCKVKRELPFPVPKIHLQQLQERSDQFLLHEQIFNSSSGVSSFSKAHSSLLTGSNRRYCGSESWILGWCPEAMK